MARLSDTRDVKCSLRLRHDEHEKLIFAAREQGVGMSEYIRRKALSIDVVDGSVQATPEFREHLGYEMALIIIALRDEAEVEGERLDRLSKIIHRSLGKIT